MLSKTYMLSEIDLGPDRFLRVASKELEAWNIAHIRFHQTPDVDLGLHDELGNAIISTCN